LSGIGLTGIRAMKKGNVQTLLSLFVLAAGLGLLAMMITSEGEPGAIPLALILIGGVWFGVTRLRGKRRADPGP
jgi:hypothetical protein